MKNHVPRFVLMVFVLINVAGTLVVLADEKPRKERAKRESASDSATAVAPFTMSMWINLEAIVIEMMLRDCHHCLAPDDIGYDWLCSWKSD